MSFLKCYCGRRREVADDEEALLIHYDEETTLQQNLHRKIHSYQKVRALAQGYLPSTEQIIANMRGFLASEFLRIDNPDVSESGQRLIKLFRQWIQEFMTLLEKKNSNDQIQNFFWFLAHSRLKADTAGIARRLQRNSAITDATAAFESLKTIGSLLLMNPDFRLFLDDASLIVRQMVADTASSLATAAESTADDIRPSTAEAKQIEQPGADDKPPPSTDNLIDKSKAITQAVGKKVEEAASNLQEEHDEVFYERAKRTAMDRLRQAVVRLRKRPDYSNSVDVIGVFIQHYINLYSTVAKQSVDLTQDQIKYNKAVERAAQSFWSLISSFGEKAEWEALSAKTNKVLEDAGKNPKFEELTTGIASSVEAMLRDPEFFVDPDAQVVELRTKINELLSTEGSLGKDVEDATNHVQRVLRSVFEDPDIQKIVRLSERTMATLFSGGRVSQEDLIGDFFRAFLPLLVQAIQHITIPRIEIATPEVDVLLENLILEPGKTKNNSSFLPFRLRVETNNNVEIRKARFRVHSSLTSLMTIKLDGITFRADDLGYWMRAHSGLARLTDGGVASFQLDERGMDVHVDVEIGREQMEHILSLRNVKVKIHHLNYKLRRSSFSWLAWLMKPLIRPLLRKTLEKEIAKSLEAFLHAANRELLFARERLRATQIADPQSLSTFIRAIVTRLTPREDPDLYTYVGMRPSNVGVFKGRYTPGSLVKLWEQEGRDAEDRVQDFEVGGWRNEVFDALPVV